MGSSKQMLNTLKMKMLEAHKAGEGYKKTAKHFQVALSSLRNVIKKYQLTRTVEIKIRSGKPSNISLRVAHRIAREVILYLRLTTKELQKNLADSGVVVHYSTVQRHLQKYGFHGRVIKGKSLRGGNLKEDNPLYENYMLY